jgi:hypothetical protein
MTKENNGLPENQTSKDLFESVVALIEQSRKLVALTVNREVTLLNWQVGKSINQELLREQRAEYGEQVIASLNCSAFRSLWYRLVQAATCGIVYALRTLCRKIK